MNQTLATKLRVAVLFEIENLQIAQGYVVCWDNASAKLLQLLVEEKILSRDSLSDRVHRRIMAIGRECFLQHQNGEYPDHVSSVDAFAYALKHGEFIEEEKRSIRFDHGETVEIFIQHYDRDVKERVVMQLLTEEEVRLSTSHPGL